jgi:serine phosphatase RsbU (regulator of sigma subunit)
MTAALTAYAVLVTVRPSLARTTVLIPVLDFIAVGLFRFATGASTSPYTAIMIIPIVWLAAQPGRRFVGYGLGGTAVALLTPFVLGMNAGVQVVELTRLLYVLAAFAALGYVVNELSRQAQLQVRSAQAGEERVTQEIDRAAAVQRSLLPQSLCAIPGVSVAGTCLPATTVGGDFFDWYRTEDGIAITLGDVMGKGVGAGLIAAAVRAVIRSSRLDPDPGAALVRASDGLATDVGERAEGSAFTTLFHARLVDDTLRWSDAGHGLTVVIREDGTDERLAATNLPLGLGIDDDWETSETPLEPGDLVVSFSDGVLDLFGGGLDTIDRVVAIARRDPQPSAVVEALAAIARDQGHDDDVTVVALRREPVPADGPSRGVPPIADRVALTA